MKKVTGGFRAVDAWEHEGHPTAGTTMSDSEIFNAAVKQPPDERAAFLDQACGANRELRHEVESLLQAHEASVSFLREPLDRTATYEPSAERAGMVIDQYKLIEPIGEGGMGTV